MPDGQTAAGFRSVQVERIVLPHRWGFAVSLLESFRRRLCRRHRTPLRFSLPAQLHIEVIPAGAKNRKRPEQWFWRLHTSVNAKLTFWPVLLISPPGWGLWSPGHTEWQTPEVQNTWQSGRTWCLERQPFLVKRKQAERGILLVHISVMMHNYSVLKAPNRQEWQLFYVKVVHTPVIVRKVMEMSRLVAQLTAATTDTALPLTPIGKISLMTTYTTEKTTDEGTKTTNHAWLQGKWWVQTFGRYLCVTL